MYFRITKEDGITTENPPKANSIIENRFGILKCIYLNNRSQHRIDEFPSSYSNTKIAVSESLQPRAKSPIIKRKRFPELERAKSPRIGIILQPCQET